MKRSQSLLFIVVATATAGSIAYGMLALKKGKQNNASSCLTCIADVPLGALYRIFGGVRLTLFRRAPDAHILFQHWQLLTAGTYAVPAPLARLTQSMYILSRCTDITALLRHCTVAPMRADAWVLHDLFPHGGAVTTATHKTSTSVGFGVLRACLDSARWRPTYEVMTRPPQQQQGVSNISSNNKAVLVERLTSIAEKHFSTTSRRGQDACTSLWQFSRGLALDLMLCTLAADDAGYKVLKDHISMADIDALGSATSVWGMMPALLRRITTAPRFLRLVLEPTTCDRLEKLRTALSDVFLAGDDFPASRLSEAQCYEYIVTALLMSVPQLASIIYFTFASLASEKDVQAKARAIVRTAQAAQAENPRCPGYPHRQGPYTPLDYLWAVVRETLRLYPSVPFLTRCVTPASACASLPFFSDGTSSFSMSLTSAVTFICPLVPIDDPDKLGAHGEPHRFMPERWLDMKQPQDDVSEPTAERFACDSFYGQRAFGGGCSPCPAMLFVTELLMPHVVLRTFFVGRHEVRVTAATPGLMLAGWMKTDDQTGEGGDDLDSSVPRPVGDRLRRTALRCGALCPRGAGMNITMIKRKKGLDEAVVLQ
eukprot:PhM_4_TR9765/c0_g1_i1/m.95205